MKVRDKLSLLFSGLSAAILLAFAALVYFSAARDRKTEFYNRLKKEAITKANLFFNAKVNSKTLQTIYLSNREILNEVEAAIYDTTFKLLYHDAEHIDVVKENKHMMNEILEKKEILFYQNDWQVVGLNYAFEGHNYLIVAAAYDQYGYTKLRSLEKNMFIMFLCAIAFIYIAGRFFSQKALAPVVEMDHKARNISATNLHLRIDARGRDELAGLADTFNQMLERLEQSFESQQDFVSNISHELRTPLAAMITELQLSQNKERSLQEYKTVISNALNDAQKLAKLSNSLLDFAKANYDSSVITFKDLRLDEVLLDAQHDLLKSNIGFNVSISYENESEEETVVMGNAYLLKTAFINLMENACKFSDDNHCRILMAFKNNHARIEFTDRGIGIPENDLSSIFLPFFRGDNKDFTAGNGIGLSLTEKIIQLHQGTIAVSSIQGQGSVFTVIL